MNEIFQIVFENASVAGIPLLAFVLGLVQWIKGFGLSGAQVKVKTYSLFCQTSHRSSLTDGFTGGAVRENHTRRRHHQYIND